MSRESAVPSPRHPRRKTSGKQVLVHLWGRNPGSPQTAAHSGLDTTAIDARGRLQSSEFVRAVRFGVADRRNDLENGWRVLPGGLRIRSTRDEAPG